MTSNFYCAENMKEHTAQAISEFLKAVNKAINSNQISNVGDVKNTFKNLYRTIFNDKTIKNKSSVFESLLFDSLYNIAIENDEKTMVALDLYDKCGIIEGLTFFIYQLTDSLFDEDKIKTYLDKMRNESYFKANVFYFSRVNRNYVRNSYSLSVEELTPKELYFSISTGYYFLREYRKALTNRLKDLIIEYINKESIDEILSNEWNINNPLFVLKRLYDDGFVPRLDTACKYCNIDSIWIEKKSTRYWG